MNGRQAKLINKAAKKLNRDPKPLKQIYYDLTSQSDREAFARYWKERLHE